MKRTRPISPDLLELVNGLRPDEIRAKLLELDSQQQALRALLKVANAREKGKEAAHVS